MRRLLIIITTLCQLPLLMASGAAFSYDEGNFDNARRRATAEGKMLLVDFYASWCAPCRWMDETTFADSAVLETMDEGYVTVKVNIDDFDGYALKEHYEVRVLPTVLIFNHDGKIIERIEETLSPSKMKSLLDKNKATSSNVVHTPNTAPVSSYSIDESLSEPASIRGAHYSLQLGVFGSYKQTLDYYRKAKSQMKDPMIILNEYKGTSVVYRVLTGNFDNTTDAEIYKTKLKTEYGIESTLYY